MEDKLNKSLIKNLSGYINPKTKKPVHNPKKMKSQIEKENAEETGDDSSGSVSTAPRNVPSGYDIWRPSRPLRKDKK